MHGYACMSGGKPVVSARCAEGLRHVVVLRGEGVACGGHGMWGARMADGRVLLDMHAIMGCCEPVFAGCGWSAVVSAARAVWPIRPCAACTHASERSYRQGRPACSCASVVSTRGTSGEGWSLPRRPQTPGNECITVNPAGGARGMCLTRWGAWSRTGRGG